MFSMCSKVDTVALIDLSLSLSLFVTVNGYMYLSEKIIIVKISVVRS